MRPVAPVVHESVPVRVFAEGQEEFKPLSVAIFRDGAADPYPGVFRLVTAYRPTAEEEARLLATLRELTVGVVPTAMLRRIAEELFIRHPIVLELLSGDGRLTPQSVYLGVPDWMRAPGAVVAGGR